MVNFINCVCCCPSVCLHRFPMYLHKFPTYLHGFPLDLHKFPMYLHRFLVYLNVLPMYLGMVMVKYVSVDGMCSWATSMRSEKLGRQLMMMDGSTQETWAVLTLLVSISSCIVST